MDQVRAYIEQGASLSMFEPNPSAKIFLHPPEDDDG